jgi:hypothetical protein
MLLQTKPDIFIHENVRGMPKEILQALLGMDLSFRHTLMFVFIANAVICFAQA